MIGSNHPLVSRFCFGDSNAGFVRPGLLFVIPRSEVELGLGERLVLGFTVMADVIFEIK